MCGHCETGGILCLGHLLLSAVMWYGDWWDLWYRFPLCIPVSLYSLASSVLICAHVSQKWHVTVNVVVTRLRPEMISSWKGHIGVICGTNRVDLRGFMSVVWGPCCDICIMKRLPWHCVSAGVLSRIKLLSHNEDSFMLSCLPPESSLTCHCVRTNLCLLTFQARLVHYVTITLLLVVKVLNMKKRLNVNERLIHFLSQFIVLLNFPLA